MRRLVVALSCALVLAGCGGDPKADPSPAPSSPTTSASPMATPPAMPDAAKANTKAGAVAFVKYYIELINHAQATGDVDALASVEDPGCKSCNKVREGLTEIYGSGGHVEGGDWKAKVRDASVRPDLKAWSVFIDVRFGPQTVVRKDGPTSLDGGKSPMTFVVKMETDSWLVLQWSRGA